MKADRAFDLGIDASPVSFLTRWVADRVGGFLLAIGAVSFKNQVNRLKLSAQAKKRTVRSLSDCNSAKAKERQKCNLH